MSEEATGTQKLESLMAVINAARGICEMKSPSLHGLMRRHGYGYEADKIEALYNAVDAARRTS